jgi:2-dehydro-3-deoxygluconokinase
MTRRVAIIGEGMLELRRRRDGSASLGWGGDTLNTAVYLARLGVEVSYITAVGTDPESDALVEAWRGEGIDCTHVLRHPTRSPGLYAIRTDEKGERSFTYWRGESAARALFETPGVEEALAFAATADCVFLSGITLSIFDDAGRSRLLRLTAGMRKAGRAVAFDPNYRPKGWASREAARVWIEAVGRCATILLPTDADDDALFGPALPQGHAMRWVGEPRPDEDAAPWEVAIKRGAHGVVVFAQDLPTLQEIRFGVEVPVEGAPVVVDTTGAGDAFNAGYLAARLRGRSAIEAAREGNCLAGVVIGHPGAIAPRAATDALGAQN